MEKVIEDMSETKVSEHAQKSPISDIKEEREAEENRCPMCGKDVGERKLCPHCGMCSECCTCGQEES